MAGGLLQLVTNQAPQTMHLNWQPEVTLFKKIFRRNTSFSSDDIDLAFASPMDFGKKTKCRLLPHGDLLRRLTVVAEIPSLSAAFLDTKAEELIGLIRNSPIADQIFSSSTIKSIDSNVAVDFNEVLGLVNSQINTYTFETTVRENVLIELNNPTSLSKVNASNINDENQLVDLVGLETETNNFFNFVDFKYQLGSLLSVQKTYDYLIYEFIRSLYEQENAQTDQYPLLNTALVSQLILYVTTFYVAIPSREILFDFLVKSSTFTNQNQTLNSLIEAFNLQLTILFNNIYDNLPNLLNINGFYDSSAVGLTVSNPAYSSLNSYFLLKQVCASLDNQPGQQLAAQSYFNNFGISQKYILNDFNTVIKMLNSLGTTVPLVSVKAVQTLPHNPLNIYAAGVISLPLNPTLTKYSAIIDPNFQTSFLKSFNNGTEIYGDNQTYKTPFVNDYLRLINQQYTFMFNNLQNGLNSIYDFYQNTSLFANLENFLINPGVGINYQFPLNYLAPVAGPPPFGGYPTVAWTVNGLPAAPDYVFNLNILVPNFLINIINLISPFAVPTGTLISEVTNIIVNDAYVHNKSQSLAYLSFYLQLLYYNLADYFNEIVNKYQSIMDQNPGPTDPSGTGRRDFRYYYPPFYNVPGQYSQANLVIFNYVFHRGMVPTLLEVFQYIFYYLDNITVANLNSFFTSNITIDEHDQSFVNGQCQTYFQQVFKIFMDIYDGFGLESPANYTYSDITVYRQSDAVTAANNDFSGNGLLLETQIQSMQMIFVLEMMHLRELGKFYSNVVFNEDLIKSNVGDTTYQVIKLVNSYFVQIDNNFTPNITAINSDPNRVKVYWQQMYQHNIKTSQPDNLYYNSFALIRATPQQYEVETEYYDHARPNPVNYTLTGLIDNAVLFTPGSTLVLASPTIITIGIGTFSSGTFVIITGANNPDNNGIYEVLSHIGTTLVLKGVGSVVPTYDFITPNVVYDTVAGGVITKITLNINPAELSMIYWNAPRPGNYNTVSQEVNQFELMTIDYVRIQHYLLHNLPTTGAFTVDDLQDALLENITLTQQYLANFTGTRQMELYFIYITLVYLAKGTLDPTAAGYSFLSQPVNAGPIQNYLQGIMYTLGINSVTITYTTAPFTVTYNSSSILSTQANVQLYYNAISTLYNQNISFYTYNQLVANNKYTTSISQLSTLTTTTNIASIIEPIRDNFKSQYYYYGRFSTSINNINGLQQINDQLDFKNIGYLYNEILSATNIQGTDLSLLSTISPLVYLYPDIYTTQITELNVLIHGQDDYSQAIDLILTNFVDTYAVQRRTMKDTYDLVNVQFEMIKQIVNYISANNITTVTAILTAIDPSLTLKVNFFNDIYHYFIDNIFSEATPVISPNDITQIGVITAGYGLSVPLMTELLTNISFQFNGAIRSQQNVILNVQLHEKLDYIIIASNLDPTTYPYITFKKYINSLMFTPAFTAANPVLQTYFNLIQNNNYQFILFAINYATANKLSASQIVNPINLINLYDIAAEEAYISTQYNFFASNADFFDYLEDYVFDWMNTIGDTKYANTLLLENVSNRISFNFNEIHLQYNAQLEAYASNKITDAALYAKYLADQASVAATVAAQAAANQLNRIAQIQAGLKLNLNSTQLNDFISASSGSIVPVSDYNYYVKRNQEQADVIAYWKTVITSSLQTIKTNSDKLVGIRNSIYNLLYHNKSACAAWIKKLGHYLVKNVSIIANGQILDKHYGDWLDIWYEMTHYDGHDSGYNRMIGNIPILTDFNSNVKPSQQLYIPLQFWHCRNSGLSIPLVSLLHTHLELEIEFRPLNELTFKEQFSTFINSATGSAVTPTLGKTYVIGEYIYLDEAERKMFITNKLEYLMEQIQTDYGKHVTDTELTPIYEVGIETIPVNTFELTGTTTPQGIPIQQLITTQVLDPNQGNYVLATDLNESQTPSLIPRSDLRSVAHTDPLTGSVTYTVENVPRDAPINYHGKVIEYRLDFSHPVELWTMIIRMDEHVDPTLRKDDTKYFYGEHQLSNYSLYSTYDLTAIVAVKAAYYNTFYSQISNPADPTYGFIQVLQIVKNIYLTNYTSGPTDPIEYIIFINYELFIATINRLLLAFNPNNPIIELHNTIRLKENLWGLNIYYNVYDITMLNTMVANVYTRLGIPFVPATLLTNVLNTMSNIIVGFNPNSFSIGENVFTNLMLQLLLPYINNGTLSIGDMGIAVGYVYQHYNEIQINLIIYTIAQIIDIEVFSYGILNIINYFYDIYYLLPTADSHILTNVQLIITELNKSSRNNINLMNTSPTVNFYYKNIIYNTVPIVASPTALQSYVYNIPITITNILAKKLNIALNSIIQTTPVTIVDYMSLAIPNPKINPLKEGYIKFNQHPRFHQNADAMYWNSVWPYQSLPRTPDTGINIYSFSLDPIFFQPTGTANFTKIDQVHAVYTLEPEIGNNHPATIYTYLLNNNVFRCLSGLCGLAFER